MKKTSWTPKKISFFIILGTLIIIFGYAGFLVYMTWPITEYSINKSGVFGDSFGVVTALFSGFAFAGLIWTICLQNDELNQTKKEFLRQSFENTFFHLTKQQYDITKSIEYGREPLVGIRVFRELYTNLKKQYEISDQLPKNDHLSDEDYISLKVGVAYNGAFSEQKLLTDGTGKTYYDLELYFRSFFSILNFIDKSSIDNKDIYIEILLAQLSSHELLIIFYYGLSDAGKKSFEDRKSPHCLIEESGLFRDFPFHLLADYQHHHLYDRKAFPTGVNR
jgi:hypothetical protein